MFEFLFKYPLTVFEKGRFVLLGTWPRWVLAVAAIAAAAALAGVIWRKRERLRPSMRGARAAVLWGLQCALLTLLLLLLWQPAISVTALKPQQNIVAVVVDDSRSMALQDVGGSKTREQQATDLVGGTLERELSKRFQVRLYRLDAGVERAADLKQFQANASSTQIGKGLRQLADEAATLPIGAVVLLSDGADGQGGVDLETLNELKRRRLPVHTVGFGKTELTKDLELDGLDVPAKALEGSRLQAQVKLRQRGFSGQKAKLILTGSGAALAESEITLRDTPEQVETLEFSAGKEGGVKNLEVRVEPLAGETNTANNRLTRVLAVDVSKRHVLYVEGEPRWEYKFLRRALDDDPGIAVVSMLRTTQNKIYRQGIKNPNDLEEGFPSKPEELFEYDGLVIGSVESTFFSSTQQQSIKDFVDRRGGGLLFLAGRWALADGGYNVAPFSELLPVQLPARKDTFRRDFVAAELTDAGKKSMVVRIEDEADKSIRHWEVLPYLANYQDPGAPKPGAVVLAQVNAGGKRVPLLITENYGRGRSGVFATAGSWRWRMQQPVGDSSQEMFWRQMLRWVAGATPTRVVASTPNAHLEDDGKVQLRAEVRDKAYLPAGDAEVEAHVIGPDGAADTVTLRPDPQAQGIYSAEWNAAKPGSYIAEITANESGQTAAKTDGPKRLGKDVVTFRREDGSAENFHREQNRELLEKISEETGGKYYTVQEARKLGQDISYSEAGITAREMKHLWDMPAVFLLVILLRSAEWLLRRKWGVV